MHPVRLLALFTLLAVFVAACTPLRGGSRRGDRGDDDDASDDDDAVGDDDDAVGDDDDVTSGDDDDSHSDDDDFADDDDFTDPQGSASGTWIIEYDLGSDLEDAGFSDCEVTRWVDDTFNDPPGSCSGCEVNFLVDLIYSDMTCSSDLFSETPGDVDNIGIGFGGGSYWEYSTTNSSWNPIFSGTQGGSPSDGYFFGQSEWFDPDDSGLALLRLVVDLEWD